MATPTPGTPSLLRAINDRAALELLLARGPLSRTELGALTGLSKPTASQLLTRLKAAGLVVLEGHREGLRGPSAELYALNPRAAHVAGLDVTPARIRSVVADITGTVVGEYELPTPGRAGGDPVARVRTAVEGAARAADLTAADLHHVVIGTPGAINPRTGHLGYALHLAGWHAPGLFDRIRADLGIGVDIENDVNLVAMAELVSGEARQTGNFVLLWVSDGIGMAVVLGGALHRGATGGAGEVGYMPLPGAPVVRDVSRQNTGGFQDVAGGPAVRRMLREHGFVASDPAVALARAAAAIEAVDSGIDTTARAIDRANRAAAALDELSTRLATGLAVITSVLDPELVVLAGDVARAGDEPLRRRIEAELHSMAIPRPELRLSSVEGNPVLVGAVHLALTAARGAVFGSTVA